MTVRAQVTFSSNLAQLIGDLDAKLIRGENQAAERLKTLSNEVAPMQTGDMIAGSAVIPAQDPEEGAAVVYTAVQAARLHEHPEYNFSKDENPKAQGKFLEQPAVENRKELGDIIRKQVTDG